MRIKGFLILLTLMIFLSYAFSETYQRYVNPSDTITIAEQQKYLNQNYNPNDINRYVTDAETRNLKPEPITRINNILGLNQGIDILAGSYLSILTDPITRSLIISATVGTSGSCDNNTSCNIIGTVGSAFDINTTINNYGSTIFAGIGSVTDTNCAIAGSCPSLIYGNYTNTQDINTTKDINAVNAVLKGNLTMSGSNAQLNLLSEGDINASIINSGGGINIRNNKYLTFLTAAGADDGTRLYKTTADGMAFDYAGNTFIYKATNDKPINYRTSTGSTYAAFMPLTKRVCINCSVAATTLDVNGIITANNNLTMSGSNAQLNLSNTGDINGDTATFTTANLTNLTNNYIPYHISDTSGLANSPIYTDGTSVGIGTTSPATKLEVAGTTYINLATSDTVYQGGQLWLGTGAYTTLREDTSLRFNIDTYNAGAPLTALTVQQNGNVGIGTTSPDDKLQVAGNVIIGDSAAGTDYTLTFDGETNNGILTWMEDEDYFSFNDGILIPSTEQVYFRDTAISISSAVDGYLDLTADTSVDIESPLLAIKGDMSLINGKTFTRGTYVVSKTINYATSGFAMIIALVDDGYVVTDVYAEVTTVWNGNGVVTIGDNDDADGFLTDVGITQTTLGWYGTEMSADSGTGGRGVYMGGGDADGYWAIRKAYSSSNIIQAAVTQGTSTQGVMEVYVVIQKLK